MDDKTTGRGFFGRVRAILFDCWDPTGFGPEYLPADEYDSYARPICSTLTNVVPCSFEDLVAENRVR